MTHFNIIKDYETEYSTDNFQVDTESYWCHAEDDLQFLSHIECNTYFKGKLSSEMVMGLRVFHSIEDTDRFFERLEKKCQVMLVLLEHVGIVDYDIESVADSLLSKFNIGDIV